MTEPTEASGSGPAPKGSAPGTAATTEFPAADHHRAEGTSGGVSTAHSGGAAGRAAPMVSPTERRGPLESVLVLRRIDPWSAFTTVLGLMFALYLVWMVAIGVTYLLLSGMGVWDRLGGLLSGVAGDDSAAAIGPSTIFLYSGGGGRLHPPLLSLPSARPSSRRTRRGAFSTPRKKRHNTAASGNRPRETQGVGSSAKPTKISLEGNAHADPHSTAAGRPICPNVRD